MQTSTLLSRPPILTLLTLHIKKIEEKQLVMEDKKCKEMEEQEVRGQIIINLLLTLAILALFLTVIPNLTVPGLTAAVANTMTRNLTTICT